MAATFSWRAPGFWAAVETRPPFRLIGLYLSQEAAVRQAGEFGSPAEVCYVADGKAATALVERLRTAREGR